MVVLKFYFWLNIGAGLIQAQVCSGLPPAGTAHQFFTTKFTDTVTSCAIFPLIFAVCVHKNFGVSALFWK